MNSNALEIITQHVEEGLRARERFFQEQNNRVIVAAQMMARSLAQKNKILICGNGGSAADAQHLAAEFVNRFQLERPPLAAVALTTDSSILTSIGNDFSFDQIFSKQVLALGQTGDVLLAISTSGNSSNVLQAIEAARGRGLGIIGLTGRNGGQMSEKCDILLNVEHANTAVVQEVHLAVEHLLCKLCDYYLFEDVQALLPLLRSS